MIYGIGTDIVSVQRISAGLSRYGDRFARRILGETELAGFCGATSQAHYLAKRFAAKEATVKALGTGFRDGLALSQITVNHDPLGKPTLEFSGKALTLVRQLGIEAAHLSLADEKEYAIAFVTLMVKGRAEII